MIKQRNCFGIAVLLVFLLLLSSTFAQEVDEDALFGSDSEDIEDDLFGTGSDDDLFGSDDMVEDLAEEDAGPAAYTEFLVSDEVQIGGSLNSFLSAYWSWLDIPQSDEEFRDNVTEQLGMNLGATVYLNARPSSDLRIFMKARTNYPFTTSTGVTIPQQANGSTETNINTLNMTIFELYSDVNWDQTLYLRFGKQTVNWGVGYFWSPADFISLVPIDPEEPEAEREGPVAIKASLPIGLNNIDAYVIADETVKKVEDLGVAARGSFYFDFGDIGLETQLGIGYQKDRPFRIMTTLRLPLRDFNIFAEGRLSFGRQGKKILSANMFEDDNAAYFSGTLGFSLITSDIFESILDLSLFGQYYFNGEGYSDPELLALAFRAVRGGDLHASAIENFGQHYTALSLAISQLFLEGLSLSTLWQANWSDLSGQVITSLSYRFFDGFSLSLGIINSYGVDPSEYGKIAGAATLKNRLGALAFSVTLALGGGRF